MDILEKAEDQERAIIQNSIKYLDSLTKINQLNVPTLKSLYRTKCRLLELRWKTPQSQQPPYQRCQRCFMNFSEADTKCEVRKVKLTQFARKVVAKVNKGVPLTSFQRIYYKKIKKKYPNGFQRQNKLVFTCQFCQEECVVFMNKPKVPKKPKVTETPAKVKKHKKKDKFCGLNKNLVMLSSTKKKRKNTPSADLISVNLDNTNNNLFVPPQASNFDVSVSMENTRRFAVETGAGKKKRKQTVKMSKKEENLTTVTAGKVSKVTTKLQQKSNNSLAQMLKKVEKHKEKPQSKLKDFLSSLQSIIN